MLIIEAANISGFFSYPMHETIPLNNQGIVLLTGINHDRLATTANAAGKSSLLNAITHILYGQNPTEKGEDKIINEVWDHGCWGMVRFTNNSNKYRIILTRNWKDAYPDETVENEPCQVHTESGRYEGTCLYYDIFENGRWQDLRKARVTETRTQIISNLGISYERFLATSYLAQQKGLAFISGRNKDRMDLITELTDMKIWDECVTKARQRLKMIEPQIENMNVEIAKWNGRAVAFAITSLPDPEVSRNIAKALTDTNIALQLDSDQQSATLSDIAVKRIDMRSKISNAEILVDTSMTEVSELKRRIADETTNINRLDALKGQPIKDPNAENGNATHMDELASYKRNLQHRLDSMLPNAGKCDKCGSNVSDATLAGEKATLLAELSKTTIRIDDLNVEMATLTKSSQTAYEAAIDIYISDATRTMISLADELTTAEVAYITAKRAVTDITAADLELMATSTKIQIELIKSKLQIETNVQQIKTIEVALERDADIKRLIEEAKDEADKARHALDLMRESQRYHEVIVKGMGDKGVKAHKFGAMIQTLNDLVAENIRVLTDSQVQVWFSPWREKANAKGDDDIVPEIQIFVREGPKEQVELALYSGMERQQIVIAIMRAFNKLAILQGAGTNILFMDEMFGMFDEASANTAIKLMNQLKNSDWGTIIVVTHNSAIEQVLQYDQLWTAKKQNHLTTLIREAR